jgi:hypothetical protein
MSRNRLLVRFRHLRPAAAAIKLGANTAHGHAFRPLTILAALTGLVLIALSIFVCYGFADGWHESWELRE